MYPVLPARSAGTDCSATNGCGVHVHVGTGPDACTNTTTQGGHWWNDTALPVDPWAVVGYLDTSVDGAASFADCVYTGSMESLGSRAFIVHANDGSRVACGLMETDESPMFETMTTTTTELGDSGVASEVTVMTNVFADVPDGVCFVGTATGLEAGIDSAYALGGTGTDCTATNGCGVHIHSGTACDDADTQGGHLYDSETVPVDPWIIVGYT